MSNAPSEIPVPEIHERHLAREWALCGLYACEVAELPLTDQVVHELFELLDSTDAYEVLNEAQRRRVHRLGEALWRHVRTHLAELDGRIAPFATNWRLDRMACVDRNILRLAVYELTCVPEVPPLVSIDEAVELAKEFGDRESSAFVNGILDAILRSLKLPPEQA